MLRQKGEYSVTERVFGEAVCEMHPSAHRWEPDFRQYLLCV